MKDIVSTVIRDDLSAVVTENLEVLLDSVIQDGILKDIPVLGNLFSVYKIGTTVADRIFARNILLFLHEIKDISIEKRQNKIDEIDNDEKYKIKTGEFLLSIIPRIESVEKAKFIGYLFSQYLSGEIEKNHYLKLTYLVQRIFWSDLVELCKSENIDRKSNSILIDVLISHGIMTIHDSGIFFDGGTDSPVDAKLNNLGKLLKAQISIFMSNDKNHTK